MAKGVHSKRRKRNQSLKRKILYERNIFLKIDLYKPKLEEVHKRLMKRTYGMGDDSVVTNKRNAFRYPKDPEAVFPQQVDPKFIDRRVSAQPVEFLLKVKQTKQKKKKDNLQAIQDSMKFAVDKVEGNLREDVVIDINNIDMETDFDNLNIEKNKKRNKEVGMDIDGERQINKRHRKQRKSKSHYIINY
jgi:hypothetical protein